MVDQIKITVIATGFDEAKMRLQKMVLGKPKLEEKVLTVKQVIEEREKEKGREEEEVPPEIPPEEMGEEFDIPAFLRQGH
jgi:hypothetical protein